MAPDHTASPVAGSVETIVSAGSTRFTTSACILLHCLAHSANCPNLLFERLPVVVRRDRLPYGLHLLDVHRAGLGVGPISVRLRQLASRQQRREVAEWFLGVQTSSRIVTAPPIEEDAVNFVRLQCQSADQRRGKLAVVVAAGYAEPTYQSGDEFLLETIAPPAKAVGQRRCVGDQRQASRQLRQIPMDRLRLTSEGVQPVMVEIS